MAPLDTGRYIITNCKHGNIAILPDANDRSNIVACNEEKVPGEMWKVDRLSNGTYKIQNCDHKSFANCENSAKASQGDDVVGGSRPQQWKITEMRSKGSYCIFPTKNTDVCWSLSDGESNSPIVLGYPANSRQNQWTFTRVEDAHVVTQSPSVPTYSSSTSSALMQETLDSAPSPSVHVQLQERKAEATKDGVQKRAGEEEIRNQVAEMMKTLDHQTRQRGVAEDERTTDEAERKALEEASANSTPAQRIQATFSDPLYIHTTGLLTSNVTLYEALATNLPSSSSPLDSIDADANHVNNVVRELLLLTQHDELNHAIFAGRMIYRRLIVYIFTHLMLCTTHKKFADEFEGTLQQWRTWDHVTVIQNHQLMKDYLWDLFQRGLIVQSNPTLHTEDAFRKLAALDAIGLCAHLTAIVTDNRTYKEVLIRRGPGAQSLLNLLQARLEFPMDPGNKACHIKALLRLSRASCLYPECLALKGIEMEATPVDRGGYGDVYKGVLHGQEIAVKALRIYQTSDLVRVLKEFSSEAVLWKQLSHPNLLPFYGVYHLEEKTPRLCLTAPWMENGNAVEFLKRYPDTYCVHLVLDMAQGLGHLHSLSPSIVHGDLKGVNVLISKSGRACLADFGVATAMDSKTIAATYSSTGKSGGTMRWQAPELLSIETESYQCNSKASDIYAFACVCYEMFSGELPFFENPYDVQVILGVMRGKRPTRPSGNLSRTRGFSDEAWNLVETCWAQEPTQRPTADQVVGRLRALPNWQDDQRPLDDFTINFPSQVIYNHTEHPFSVLATADQKAQVW